MIVRKLNVVSLIALVSLAFVLVALFPSRRKEVLRTFDRIEKLAVKDGGETPVAGALRVKQLARYLEDDVTVLLPDQEDEQLVSRKEALALMLHGWNETSYLRVRFDSIQISFPDKETAETSGDITIESGEGRFDRYENVPTFEATLVHDPDSYKWRFQRISLQPVIEK